MGWFNDNAQPLLERHNAIRNRLLPENFPDFCKYYFDLEMGDCHKEWFSKYILRNDITRLLLEAPMGHAKSTYVGVIYPIWLLLNNRIRRIILCSNALELSMEMLRKIRSNIEGNPKLIDDFGNLKPNDPIKWTEKAIYIQGSNSNGPPSIRATATGAAIAGKRCDVFIGDDIIDNKNSTTELLRKKVKDWFNTMALSRLEPKGIVRLIGTEYGEFTLYQDIIQHRGGQYPDWKTVVYRAVDPTNTGPNKELWPEMWTYEKLMEEKRGRGTIAFERGMQNNPKAAEGGIFKDKYLQYYPALTSELAETLKFYMGVDLAISSHEGANYFVIMVVGIEPKTENIYVVDIYRKHVNFSVQVDQIIEYHHKWNCLGIGIGNKAYQEVMPQHLLSIKALPIVRINESVSKEARLTKMSLYFENKKVWLKSTMTEFVDELLTYDPDDTSKSPDQCDAMFFALETGLASLNRTFVGTVAGETRKKNPWGL